MSASVKQSSYNYKYELDYNQLMLRGSSLKITQWVYGIVVYTGEETKIKKNDSKKNRLKKSKVEVLINYQILYIFIFQFIIACLGAMAGQVFDEDNAKTATYLAVGTSNEYRNNEIVKVFP